MTVKKSGDGSSNTSAFTCPYCSSKETVWRGYRYNEKTKQYEIAERDLDNIKRKVLFGLANFGRPFIYVVDGNYENRGELLLSHRHEGFDLQLNEAKDTVANVFKIWGRPVHLETVVEDKKKIFSYNGEKHEERDEPSK